MARGVAAVEAADQPTRWCVVCGETKPLTAEFFVQAGTLSRGGKREFRHRCRACSKPNPGNGKRRPIQAPLSRQRHNPLPGGGYD